ncbi:MAG: preprotein translocase subunit SecG [Lentisphaerales bacterium]|nr:preprotein translocase subunit SecG [Lentisphaerales bacterium]
MSGFLTFVLVIVSIVIVIAVIMQPSKDGGLGGLASGGVTDSVFGAGRNEFLTKATWVLMVVFLAGSLALAKMETSQRLAKESEVNKKSAAEEIDLGDDITAEPKSAIESTGENVAPKVEEKIEEVAPVAKPEAEKAKEEAPKVEPPATDK